MSTFIGLAIYRIVATTIVISPALVNVLIQGDIIASILFIPIWMMITSLIFIFLDDHLEKLLTSINTAMISNNHNISVTKKAKLNSSIKQHLC